MQVCTNNWVNVTTLANFFLAGSAVRTHFLKTTTKPREKAQQSPVLTSRGGGEERPPGCLAVTVGNLGPVLWGDHPGGDRAAFNFICAGRHASFCVAAAGGVILKVLKLAMKRSRTALHKDKRNQSCNVFFFK